MNKLKYSVQLSKKIKGIFIPLLQAKFLILDKSCRYDQNILSNLQLRKKQNRLYRGTSLLRVVAAKMVVNGEKDYLKE